MIFSEVGDIITVNKTFGGRIMGEKYLSRIADKILADRLESSGAVLIEGPKWCGKTRTATEISKSQLNMQDPDKT